jgi:hypothetical protein
MGTLVISRVAFLSSALNFRRSNGAAVTQYKPSGDGRMEVVNLAGRDRRSLKYGQSSVCEDCLVRLAPSPSTHPPCS